jgi:hypothetical protein
LHEAHKLIKKLEPVGVLKTQNAVSILYFGIALEIESKVKAIFKIWLSQFR